MGGKVRDNASDRVAPRLVRGRGRAGLAIVGALALAASVSVPVEARIACRQGAQLVGGNYISTPYWSPGNTAYAPRPTRSATIRT